MSPHLVPITGDLSPAVDANGLIGDDDGVLILKITKFEDLKKTKYHMALSGRDDVE